MKQSRPVSIIITQILMALSLVPISLVLMYSFFWTLIKDSSSLFRPRSMVFFLIALGVAAVFLIYGFGGLWKRKKYGYWLGLLFLAAVNVKNFYTFTATMRSFLAPGFNRSDGLVILDFSVQCVMLLLVFLLFLKVWLGKKEKLFFQQSLELDRGLSDNPAVSQMKKFSPQ